MLSYPNTDIVRMAVETVGFEAFTFGSPALHFPQRGGGDAEFGAEPGDRTVAPMPGITGQGIANKSLMQDIAKQTR